MSVEEEEEGVKEPKQILKHGKTEIRLTERDYRGILALVLVVGLIVILVKGDVEASSVLSTLAASVIGYYFGAKKEA